MKFIYKKIILLFTVISCTSNTIYQKPKNVLPKDSMIQLLTDMYLVSSLKNIRIKSLKKNDNYMSLIYRKYGVDSTRFNDNNIYYTSKIDEYYEMLKEIRGVIENKKKQIDKKIKVRDSINNLKKDSVFKKKVVDDDSLDSIMRFELDEKNNY